MQGQHQQFGGVPPPPPMVPGMGSPGRVSPDMGQMRQMRHGFEHMDIDTITPRTEQRQIFNPQRAQQQRPPVVTKGRSYESRSKSPVVYEGYSFKKEPAEHAGQKETWAIARKTPLPVSQRDLEEQVYTNNKKEGSALKQLNASAMDGFKRKQVEKLIEKRMQMDDPAFEYQLASIKLNRAKGRGGNLLTSTMQVIIKRRLRHGIVFNPGMSPVGPPISTSEISDVIEDSSEKLSRSASSDQELPRFPFRTEQPLSQGGRRPGMEFGGGFQPPPRVPPFPFGEEQLPPRSHSPHGQHGPRGPPMVHEDISIHDYEREKKHNKSKNKKSRDKTTPRKKNKSHNMSVLKSRKSHSDSERSSSSFSGSGSGSGSDSDTDSDLESDASSRRTDDTFPTSVSTGGRSSRSEKKHCKEKKSKKLRQHGQDIRDRYEGHERGVREHVRRPPALKHRDYSPTSSRRSGAYCSEDEHVIIRPAVSSHHGSIHARPRTHRQPSYVREAPQPTRRSGGRCGEELLGERPNMPYERVRETLRKAYSPVEVVYDDRSEWESAGEEPFSSRAGSGKRDYERPAFRIREGAGRRGDGRQAIYEEPRIFRTPSTRYRPEYRD